MTFSGIPHAKVILYEKYALIVSKGTIRLAARELFVVVEKSHSKRDINFFYSFINYHNQSIYCFRPISFKTKIFYIQNITGINK